MDAHLSKITHKLDERLHVFILMRHILIVRGIIAQKHKKDGLKLIPLDQLNLIFIRVVRIWREVKNGFKPFPKTGKLEIKQI